MSTASCSSPTKCRVALHAPARCSRSSIPVSSRTLSPRPRGRAAIMDSAHPGGLGGTYGGNPISVAAAHAVLDVIEAEDLCARASRVGHKLHTRLEALAKELPSIGD